jgi:DNA-binding NtrC family response regulator
VYQTDCRLICATNQDLDQLIDQGTFRSDLRYRLEGLTIRIPPLRSHTEDIPELVSCFLNTPDEDLPRASPAEAPLLLRGEISEEALALLMNQSWPGNIRQLKNSVLRARLLARDGIILPEHIRP